VQSKLDKTIWRRIGLIAVLLPVCLLFPIALILVGLIAWSIYADLKSSEEQPYVPPVRTWRDAKPEDDDWLTLFFAGCESPAEVQFLHAMVNEFDLKPDNGVLKSPRLTLAMQVVFANYRFDFVANGRQVIEVDGAMYHSSPEQVKRDRIRDEYSVLHGYKVLRIPAIVVFREPEEAVRGVKAALVETTIFTNPQEKRPPIPKRTVIQHVNAFVDGLNEIGRDIEIVSTTRKATEGFLAAISYEQLFLEAMVAAAELDQRKERRQMEKMSPQEQEFSLSFETLLQTEGRNTLVYEGKRISMPAPVADSEIQSRIEAAYTSAMDERNKRFAELRERCVKDPVFTKLFCQKLIEAQFPGDEITDIVVWRAHMVAHLTAEARSP